MMKKFELTLTLLIAIGTLTFVVGCGGSKEPSKSEKKEGAEKSGAHVYS